MGQTTEDVVQMKTLARQIANDKTRMIPKTIYDFKHKTKEQIADFLLHEQEMFEVANPDYQYDNYRMEDGKRGERTIYLIFKRK